MLQKRMCISVLKCSWVRKGGKKKRDPEEKCPTLTKVEPVFVLLNICTKWTTMDSDEYFTVVSSLQRL